MFRLTVRKKLSVATWNRHVKERSPKSLNLSVRLWRQWLEWLRPGSTEDDGEHEVGDASSRFDHSLKVLVEVKELPTWNGAPLVMVRKVRHSRPNGWRHG